jgi:hypothetical protein
MNTPDQRDETRQRKALPSDVRVFVEAHLRDLARADRLRELARSRDALMKYYHARQNIAAVYVLANAPNFSLAVTPGGDVALTLPDRADHVMWTQSELLQEEKNEVNEVENRAVELAGGPDKFQALGDEERETLTAQAVAEMFRRIRGR